MLLFETASSIYSYSLTGKLTRLCCDIIIYSESHLAKMFETDSKQIVGVSFNNQYFKLYYKKKIRHKVTVVKRLYSGFHAFFL